MIERPYSWHWISTRTIFTYFCCRMFSWVICTSIYFLIKDSVLAKIIYGILSNFICWLNCNISFFLGDITIPKNFIFTYYFLRIKFVVELQKNEDYLNNKSHRRLLLFLLVIQTVFLQQDDADLFLCNLKSLRELFVFLDVN